MITAMKCPKCRYPLEVELNYMASQDHEYAEVEFRCTNRHRFVVRIKSEDLVKGTQKGYEVVE